MINNNCNNNKNKIYVYTVFKGTDREFTGTIIQISNHFGFKDYIIRRRMKQYNLSLEEAIDYKK